jgi:hypothetical protein
MIPGHAGPNLAPHIVAHGYRKTLRGLSPQVQDAGAVHLHGRHRADRAVRPVPVRCGAWTRVTIDRLDYDT